MQRIWGVAIHLRDVVISPENKIVKISEKFFMKLSKNLINVGVFFCVIFQSIQSDVSSVQHKPM